MFLQEAYASPVPPSMYPQFTVLLLAAGIFFLANFFVYVLCITCVLGMCAHPLLSWVTSRVESVLTFVAPLLLSPPQTSPSTPYV